MYGENWPADYYWRASCLEDAGLTSDLWLETMRRIVDIYAEAFPQTTLLLQFAPYYKRPTERREITKYAASKSMGLKHNGLWPDANGAVITLPGWLMATDTPIGHTHQCAHGNRDAHNGALALLPAPAA